MPVLERRDARIHHEVVGEGPPVLLIQGVGVGAGGWAPQVRGLSDRFRMLTFDNRGYGRSTTTGPVRIEAMAEDALALIDAQGWPSAHVVGPSMGGVIAQQLALDHPERVRSLGLLCTLARARDAARLTAFSVWMGLRTTLGPRAWRRRAFLEMVMPPSALAAVDRDAMAAEIGALFGRDLADSPKIVFQQVRALAAHDTSARLGELSPIPTLVVSAAHDRIAPVAQGRVLAESIAGSRYIEIPDAGHGVTIHQSTAIDALLAEHWASAERARHDSSARSA